MSQADSLSMSYDGLRIGGAGDVGWCYADLTAHVTIGHEQSAMIMRFTATAQRGDEGWRFVQAHVSVPFGDQLEGESFVRPS